MNGCHLVVKGWSRWQTYRKDRGTPPWIKVHRNLFSNNEWATMTDSEKGQLVSIWLLAADKDGVIPSNPGVLRKMCLLDNSPDLEKFIDLGFLSHSDNQVTTTCQPSDAPETETETETETEAETETETETEQRATCPHKGIIDLYHKLLPELSQVRIWSDQRKTLLRSRWNEDAERQTLGWWEQYFLIVKRSDFLTGKVDGKSFRPDLEWLIRPTNMPRVIEGKYDNRKNTPKKDKKAETALRLLKTL